MSPRNFAVGDTFSLVRTCDPYRPIYYAAASGDFNPIHIDPEVGREAGLGGAILQGLCTLAWAVDAFVGYLGDPGKVSGVKARFSRPVAPHDVVTFTGKVISVENGKVVAQIEAVNQREEDVLKGATVEGRV
jgi:3-hydroxybutyryl-CoA dehydratase